MPPSYWYDTSHAGGGDQTNAGGSWGFDSEQSAGDTVPTLDSIRRFMSSSDQSNLWQNPSFNQYHLNYENGHGGYSFGQLFVFDQALTKRYGSWSDLNSYVEEAQLANYENTRAQFEAFIHHSTNSTPSTGTIYWQVNKGWPSLLWTLYNSDGDQAGAYFGAKKANENLHVLYGYDNNTVTVDNVGKGTQSGLTVEAKVYDTAGKVLDDQTVTGVSVSSQSIKTKVITPKLPATTTPPTAAKTSFVELLLSKGGTVVDRNVYWVSSQKDVVNWGSTLGNPQATMSQYGNLQGLRSLATGSVKVTASTADQSGPNGADKLTTVTVTNTASTPTVAFFLRADVRRGTGSTPASGDNQVTSTLWNDNDITLWPGESQTLTVSWHSSDLNGASPVVSLSGYNVKTVNVAA